MRAKLTHARPRLRRRRAGLRGRRRLRRHLCRRRAARRLRLTVGGEARWRSGRAALLPGVSARRRASRVTTAVLRRIAGALLILLRALLVRRPWLVMLALVWLAVVRAGTAVLAILLLLVTGPRRGRRDDLRVEQQSRDSDDGLHRAEPDDEVETPLDTDALRRGEHDRDRQQEAQHRQR